MNNVIMYKCDVKTLIYKNITIIRLYLRNLIITNIKQQYRCNT